MTKWRATLFGHEGELAFVQSVGDPPPSTISMPVVRRIKVVGADEPAMNPTYGIRIFELVWKAAPRAEYKEV
jgi:hypothetical protein